jgi:hypothetical protein
MQTCTPQHIRDWQGNALLQTFNIGKESTTLIAFGSDLHRSLPNSKLQ